MLHLRKAERMCIWSRVTIGLAVSAVLVGCGSSTGSAGGSSAAKTSSTDPSRMAIDRANDDFIGCTYLLSDWKDFKAKNLDGMVAGLSSMTQSDWAGLSQAFADERQKVDAQVATMHDPTAVQAWTAYSAQSEPLEAVIKSSSQQAIIDSMSPVIRQATAGIYACNDVMGF